MLTRFLLKVRDFIFPLQCLICSSEGDNILCSACMKNISFIKGICCNRCGYKLSDNYVVNTFICAECTCNPPLFSTLRSVMFYNEDSKKIIFDLKFSDKLHLAKLYGKWLFDISHHILSDIDIIIPVPLHRWRLLNRGYNQSSLLANSLAKYAKIDVDHLSLLRIKNTRPQSLSSKASRLSNVKNAFAIRDGKNVKNKNILLIDDVVTTGSTLHFCTKTLLESQAKSVHILTIAKTEKPLVRI